MEVRHRKVLREVAIIALALSVGMAHAARSQHDPGKAPAARKWPRS